MPEITIRYNNSKTLKALKTLSELLDFTFITPKLTVGKNKNAATRPTMIPGDRSVDISDMGEIISRNDMNAKKLRQAWQRNK